MRNKSTVIKLITRSQSKREKEIRQKWELRKQNRVNKSLGSSSSWPIFFYRLTMDWNRCVNTTYLALLSLLSNWHFFSPWDVSGPCSVHKHWPCAQNRTGWSLCVSGTCTNPFSRKILNISARKTFSIFFRALESRTAYFFQLTCHKWHCGEKVTESPGENKKYCITSMWVLLKFSQKLVVFILYFHNRRVSAHDSIF